MAGVGWYRCSRPKISRHYLCGLQKRSKPRSKRSKKKWWRAGPPSLRSSFGKVDRTAFPRSRSYPYCGSYGIGAFHRGTSNGSAIKCIVFPLAERSNIHKGFGINLIFRLKTELRKHQCCRIIIRADSASDRLLSASIRRLSRSVRVRSLICSNLASYSLSRSFCPVNFRSVIREETAFC